MNAVFLASDEIRHHVEAVTKQIPGQCGKSLKMLRENASVSQLTLGAAFHRRANAVGAWEAEKSWPPKPLMVRILQFLNIPAQALLDAGENSVAGELTVGSYLTQSSIEIEYQYFLRHRGRVLEALTNRAEEGSDQAAKIWMEWLRKNEEEHNSLANSARNITPAAREWTALAIQKRAEKVIEAITETASNAPDSVSAESPQSTDK